MEKWEVVDRVVELLEPEGCWTQDFSARDSSGQLAMYNGPDAVCWCTMGAFWKVIGGRFSEASLEADIIFDDLKAFLGVHSISSWNDDAFQTQGNVVGKLREFSVELKKGDGDVLEG